MEKTDCSKVITLEEWFCTVSTNDIHIPPEINLIVLVGVVYNHPKYEDGTPIKTSVIKESNGKYVKTINTTYYLGNPDPNYLDWLDRVGLTYDSENPVSIKFFNYDKN